MKTPIQALLTSAILAAFVTSGAQAAPPPGAKGLIAPAVTPDALTSDRLVVQYKTGTTALRDHSAKLRAVTTAAIRAGVSQRTSVPLGATYLRRMANGADVVRLSRKLDPVEQGRLVAEIANDPSVQSVKVSRRAYPVGAAARTVAIQPTAAAPNDQYYANYQWHLQSNAGGIDAPGAWDYSTGEGVVVAVIDTGILPAHPDAPVNLLEGYDFITDAETSGRADDSRVAGGIDLGDWTSNDQCGSGWVGRDSSWHGSHVAGTVAEATNNGIGMAGVAYNATVLPIRVLGHCGGWDDDIADAIVWASGGHIDGVPDNANPAEVINLSLGGEGACASRNFYQDAIDTAVANGSLVVVAAGNDSDNAGNYSPASCDNVVSVAATNSAGGFASGYSNYGSVVDISAPGGGGEQNNAGWVWQTWYDGTTTNTSGEYGYVGYIGTSMAAPHVAATAALVQSALVAAERDPLTPSDLETLLKQTARTFPVTPVSSRPIGTGIVNPVAALESALQEPCDPDIQECGPVAIELINKVNAGSLASTGTPALYRFEASAGSVLTFLTFGGTGNVSLYARRGAVPTDAVFDARSIRAGNSETIRFAAPSAGTYYLLLTGNYSGLTLVARQ